MSKSSEEGAAGNGSGPEAGNGAQKDENIYDNRAGTKKIIRVVTVMAYVFSVSFAAILLSAYYVFLWEPPNPRLQRHPLSGDPQVEFLMDNLLSSKNLNKLNESDDRAAAGSDGGEEFENPRKKFNNILFERIMTGEQEPRRSYPQKLIALQDFAESHPRADAATSGAEDPAESGSTTMPIFLKALGTIPTVLADHGVDGGAGENKGRDMGPRIESEENSNEGENGSENSNRSTPEIANDETTPAGSSESDALDVTSTRDLRATIYPGIDKRSYPEAIGATVENNKESDRREPCENFIIERIRDARDMQLPRKMSAQNMMASISRTLGTRSDSKSAAANEVKFAGEESKDKLYEPKHKQKLVRVLTVVAYVISVSLAAIILSLYYMFLWDPRDRPNYGGKHAKADIASNKVECVNLTFIPAGSSSILRPPSPATTNNVTIGTDGTIETSTSRVPELDENFETSLRRQDSRLPEDPGDERPTTNSEVQIYPGELNGEEDIIDDREKRRFG